MYNNSFKLLIKQNDSYNILAEFGLLAKLRSSFFVFRISFYQTRLEKGEATSMINKKDIKPKI